jgi:hypothetical protein
LIGVLVVYCIEVFLLFSTFNPQFFFVRRITVHLRYYQLSYFGLSITCYFTSFYSFLLCSPILFILSLWSFSLLVFVVIGAALVTCLFRGPHNPILLPSHVYSPISSSSANSSFLSSCAFLFFHWPASFFLLFIILFLDTLSSSGSWFPSFSHHGRCRLSGRSFSWWFFWVSSSFSFYSTFNRA